MYIKVYLLDCMYMYAIEFEKNTLQENYDFGYNINCSNGLILVSHLLLKERKISYFNRQFVKNIFDA